VVDVIVAFEAPAGGSEEKHATFSSRNERGDPSLPDRRDRYSSHRFVQLLLAGVYSRSVRSRRLPELNPIALRIVQAGKAAVRVMLRV